VVTSRAKIFQPFDALTGLKEAILKKEMELHIVPPPELSEEKAEELNLLMKELRPGAIIKVTYRAKDGQYYEKTGAFSGIDEYKRALKIVKDKIYINDVINIETDVDFELNGVGF